MNIENELSRRLNEWFSTRRQIMDLVERHDETSLDVEIEQYSELRNRSYDCEWNLLNLGARSETWERLLEERSDMEREEALDLRYAMPDLEIVSGKQRAVKDGLSVSAWWFIPYAVWVGLPRPSHWAHPTDHAQPMLDRVLGMFRDAAQSIIPQLISREQESLGHELRATFQFMPGMDADKLRDFVLPPGAREDWPEQAQNALEFDPDPTRALRAGCVGVYLAADSYRGLALVRDIVRELAQSVAEESRDPHLKVGPLLPRRVAVRESDMMRWELWSEQALARPLEEPATHRHVTFTVEREKGRLVRLLGHVADLDGEDVCASEGFSCRVADEEMLHQALHPFIESIRPSMTWSVRSLDVPSLD